MSDENTSLLGAEGGAGGAATGAPGGAAPAAVDPAGAPATTPAATVVDPAAASAQPGGAEAGGAKPEAVKPVVPEVYDLKAPEGTEALDTAALEQFTPVAKELGLSNEQAQKLIDLYGGKVMPQVMEAQRQAWTQQLETWVGEVKADKDIGGEALPASLAVAQRAIRQFGSPELTKALDETGMGNHPALVKFCVQVGKALAEDTVILPNAAGGKRDAASVLYGSN